MSIRKEDSHVSESSAKIRKVANANSVNNIEKLIRLAIDLESKKKNLEEDETFFQLFKETDVLHEFDSKYLLIHYAATYNLEELLKLIIKHYPNAVHSPSKHGDLAIHCTNHYNSTKILIEAGADGFSRINSFDACYSFKKSRYYTVSTRKRSRPYTITIHDGFDLPVKSLTYDKFIIECIEEYESKWIIKNNKKV